MNTTVSHESLEMRPLSVQDVKDTFDNLDVTKVCGPDLMSPLFLKEGSPVLALPYSIIFNRSLQLGHFPSHWKDANVTSIHKKDDRSSPANYRPISLLCQPGKSMERCIHKQLYNYVKSHNLITPLQSGFMNNFPTHSHIPQVVDSGKEIRVVFCGISKAFDRVCYRSLIYKLKI